MRREYDFSESRSNPYAAQLKKQITIRLDEEAIDYFKGISEEVGVPYQSLINFYLRDCATSRRKLSLAWKKPARSIGVEAGPPAKEPGSGKRPKSLKQTIVYSIRLRRKLSFTYNGRRRVIEPQCFGLGTKGTELLRGHQVRGGTEPEPLFDVARISNLVVLDDHFFVPGPNYKRGDSAMKTIYAQL